MGDGHSFGLMVDQSILTGVPSAENTCFIPELECVLGLPEFNSFHPSALHVVKQWQVADFSWSILLSGRSV